MKFIEVREISETEMVQEPLTIREAKQCLPVRFYKRVGKSLEIPEDRIPLTFEGQFLLAQKKKLNKNKHYECTIGILVEGTKYSSYSIYTIEGKTYAREVT